MMERSDCCGVRTIYETNLRGESLVCSFCYQPIKEKAMDIRAFIKIVEKIAPVIAGYLGGPVAGTALQLIASAYGVGNKLDLQAIADKVIENPYKLKELELAHKEHLMDDLMQLLDKVENRATNGLVWIIGLVLLGLIGSYVYKVMLMG